MSRRPKDVGTDAERAVARYLTANGWSSAEIRRTHGVLDLGDITGTPGLVWEVKGGHAAEQATDRDITEWLEETELERANAHADIGVLIWKRKGKGHASVGAWWAALPGWGYVYLARIGIAQASVPAPAWMTQVYQEVPPVRLLLADLIRMLRTAGYGNQLGDAA